MEFETIVSLLLGFLVPGIVSFLKQSKWHKFAKIALAGCVSLAAATAGLFVQGELHSLADVVNNTAIVWAAATAFYKLYFSDTEFNAKLEGM